MIRMTIKTLSETSTSQHAGAVQEMSQFRNQWKSHHFQAATSFNALSLLFLASLINLMGAATMEDMINQISAVDGSTGDEKIHLMFGKGGKKKKNIKTLVLRNLWFFCRLQKIRLQWEQLWPSWRNERNGGRLLPTRRPSQVKHAKGQMSEQQKSWSRLAPPTSAPGTNSMSSNALGVWRPQSGHLLLAGQHSDLVDRYQIKIKYLSVAQII